MDEAKRDRLIHLHADDPAPLVDIRTFFDGNDDEASIGCNLVPHPGIGAFREALLGLLDRADVAGVFARIAELDTGGGWPFTDTIAVVGSLSAESLRAALAHLEPDAVGPASEFGFEDEELPGDGRAWAVWWD
jgi:hypothetical protein